MTKTHALLPRGRVACGFRVRFGSGLEVRVNGVVKGSIEGDDFARASFRYGSGQSRPTQAQRPGVSEGRLERASDRKRTAW